MGTPWGPHGVPWDPWGPMGTHGNPWEPMGTHGNPWGPMGSQLAGLSRPGSLGGSEAETSQSSDGLFFVGEI